VLVAFAEQPLSLSGHTRYISNLMCWRDLDVGLLVGPACDEMSCTRSRESWSFRRWWPASTIGANGLTIGQPDSSRRSGITSRSACPWRAGIWCLDLSLWLHDLHDNVTAWHEALCDSITDEQRTAVLRINDVWFRLPSYPDQVGGFELYTAGVDDGVRTPEQFRRRLAGRGLPQT
jgi:hypothetical protein